MELVISLEINTNISIAVANTLFVLCFIQDQAKPYDSKKNVWIPDTEEGYIEAEIKSVKDSTALVVTCKGNEVFNVCVTAEQNITTTRFT